jgi:hypothetical protein
MDARRLGVARVGRLHRDQRQGEQYRRSDHHLAGDDPVLGKQPVQSTPRPLARQQQVQQ